MYYARLIDKSLPLTVAQVIIRDLWPVIEAEVNKGAEVTEDVNREIKENIKGDRQQQTLRGCCSLPYVPL